MSKHAFARSFTDLIVYQKSRASSKLVFELTKSFPKEERYSLTDQVRRAVRSVGAQISEAWAKRRYPNHFVSKLTDADGEKNETIHWLVTAFDCDYVTKEDAARLKTDLLEIGRILGRMVERSEDFKGEGYGRVKEARTAYGSVDEFFSPET